MLVQAKLNKYLQTNMKYLRLLGRNIKLNLKLITAASEF